MTMGCSDLYGIPIIETPHLVNYRTVKRTWRERLFTRPWRPRKATKVITVPCKEAYLVDPGRVMVGVRGPALVLHPAYLEEFKQLGRKAMNVVLPDTTKDQGHDP